MPKAMISSTVLDLKDHRAEAARACLVAGIEPVAMETLPAGEDPVRASLRMVDESDVFVGILGWRLTDSPPGYDKSITEMEFERAFEAERTRGMQVFVFLIDEDHAIKSPHHVTADPAAQRRLEDLKARASKGRVVARFVSPQDLRAHVLAAFYRLRPQSAVAPAAPQDGPLPEWRLVTPEFLQGQTRTLDREERKALFDGQEPHWAHATADPTEVARRGAVSQAVGFLTRGGGQNMVLLVSAGGEGKSLMLLQVAVDLVRAGHRVLHRQPEGRLDPAAVLALPEDGPWYLVSDEAEEIVEAVVPAVRRLHSAGRTNVHWVLAARDTDWNAHFRKEMEVWDRYARVWPDRDRRSQIMRLDLADAEKVVATWASADCLGALGPLPPAKRAQRLHESARVAGVVSDGTFFGAVLESRFGAAGLRAHVENLLRRLGAQALPSPSRKTLRDALLYAAAMDAVELDGIDLNLVADLVGVNRRDRRPQIVARLGLETVATGGSALRTRHPAIARTALLLLETGAVDGDLESIYLDILDAASASMDPGDRESSLRPLLFLGPYLASRLPRLGIDAGRASRIAHAWADRAVEIDPRSYATLTVTRANTYRVTRDACRATTIFRDSLARAKGSPDWVQVGRGFLFEWAVCASLCREDGLGRYYAAAWLAALSVADSPAWSIPTRKDAKRALAGIGESLVNLGYEAGPDLARLLRATTFLGRRAIPAEEPSEDAKTERAFRAHEARADDLEALRPRTETEALEWLRDGVAAVESQVSDDDLVKSVRDLVGHPLSFTALAKTLTDAPRRRYGVR